ncbi:hypothetical protein [Caryophanon tenue]|uniref:Uncharacterized protein n=1 Tax=Caryophanon tenue TaxID=33978 RepID=A0A1C0YIZ4_9BACL|nr:hypothetical protein [Caryophanon tenue]OCS87114.1 hypothetical protein A6M13_11605 [Caryophanon tenue]
MARKNLLQTNALEDKISVQGENPHQTAFSQPKARGLALFDEPIEQLPKEKKERKNSLISAEAHHFFKTVGAQHGLKLLEVVDFAVEKLRELDEEELVQQLQAYKKTI